MTSEAYTEIGGGSRRPWPRAYNEVIAKGCPRCHAKPLELCTNPYRLRTPHKAKIPCLARIRQRDDAA